MCHLFQSLLLLGVLLIAAPACSSDITAYFKPTRDKSDAHTMRNIDYIYTINLDQRPEKFELCEQQLTPYNISSYRFSAVNGWELSPEVLNSAGVKYTRGMRSQLWGTCYLPEDNGQPHHEVMSVVGRNYYCHCMSRGAIGIVLSHLSVLQDAYDSGYETIWVMEDDIEVIRNPHEISGLIDRLDALVSKKGWDVLFTDRDTKNQEGNHVVCQSCAYLPNFNPSQPERFARERQINSEFRTIGARYGTYSMIIRRSGIKKLLDFYKKYGLFLPYDMTITLPDTIRMFTVLDDVVSTMPHAKSDNGGANYKTKT